MLPFCFILLISHSILPVFHTDNCFLYFNVLQLRFSRFLIYGIADVPKSDADRSAYAFHLNINEVLL